MKSITRTNYDPILYGKIHTDDEAMLGGRSEASRFVGMGSDLQSVLFDMYFPVAPTYLGAVWPFSSNPERPQ